MESLTDINFHFPPLRSDSTHSGHRLQIESTELLIHPGVAAFGAGSVALRAQEQSAALVLEASFVEKFRRYQNGNRKIRFVLRKSFGENH